MHLLTLHQTSPSLTTKLNSLPEDSAFVPAPDTSTGLKLMQTLTNSPDVCALLNFFMNTQLITNLTPSTPKAFGHLPPTETTRLILTSTLLNMTYSPLNPDASVTTCRKLNAELYVYLNKDMTLLSSQPTKARRL